MAEAVKNGMTHLIMEVSSQAFKKNRVYGLKYDLGIFLNISPDHIGRNEHPTFEDYLYCKEQLLRNSKNVIINAESQHFDEINGAAKGSLMDDHIYLYARENSLISFQTQVDFEFKETRQDLTESTVEISSYSDKGRKLAIDGAYEVDIPGDYNQENAIAAIVSAAMTGVSATEIRQHLPEVRVPGRMEVFQTKDHGTVYIDYAHNYASLKSLLSFLRQQIPDERLIVLTGSTGDKGISRRSGLGQAISEEADVAILTSDDPATEDPLQIAQEIDQHIDHDQVEVQIVLDRKTAVKQAIMLSKPGEIVVLAGKGRDATQKLNGKNVPYETDVKIAEDLIKER
jgi:UDP-N-acetylmuramyl tripeptide synthase